MKVRKREEWMKSVGRLWIRRECVHRVMNHRAANA